MDFRFFFYFIQKSNNQSYHFIGFFFDFQHFETYSRNLYDRIFLFSQLFHSQSLRLPKCAYFELIFLKKKHRALLCGQLPYAVVLYCREKAAKEKIISKYIRVQHDAHFSTKSP